MATAFERPIDLLGAAHRIDTGESYPTYPRDGESPPHRLELAVAVRSAIDTRASRSLSRLWPSNRELAEELGVTPRTVARWRDGTRSVDRSPVRSRLSEASVRRYVSSPPSATGNRRLGTIRTSGADVTFEGDFSILNWTNPPVRQLRRSRTIEADYISPRELQGFVGTARAGAWELAAAELESAFWPPYFRDEGDATELEPRWVHAERLTILGG